MARTVDSVTPMSTYSAVLLMLERTASSLNRRRKLSSPVNLVGGFSSCTRKKDATIVYPAGTNASPTMKRVSGVTRA